ncbi:hypothetical protein KKHFBJBL_01777 [Brevundimonas sp. NIBR11]|nr:hypothetical protein KKHFBJBL_01777 [Brevundimonas sp. NIBR11]
MLAEVLTVLHRLRGWVLSAVIVVGFVVAGLQLARVLHG